MLCRLILVLLVGGAASGCFGDKGSAPTEASATPTSLATPAIHELTLHGVPVTGIAVGETYAFAPSVAASGTPVSYAIEGQPQWASFDAATGALTGTPGPGDVGLSGDITITASDGVNTGSVGPFDIRVLATAVISQGGIGARGTGPVISGDPSPSATAGQPYVFQPQARDILGKPLTYAIVNRPSWATFSTATGTLSGTPSADEIGTYTGIQILVSDGISAGLMPAFSISVSASASDMPFISGSPPSAVIAGQGYQFSPTAGDPSSQPLTYSASNLPPWASLDPTSGSLTGTPSVAQAGVYPNISITVSNGLASASLGPFTITVTPPSADTPTIEGTPSGWVDVGAAFSFRPTASDPAGKALTFAIVGRPVWAEFDPLTGRLSGTPSSADVGTYSGIGISVTNGTSSASLNAFSIVVSAAASTEVSISGTPAATVVVGSPYRFTPSARDSIGAALRFSIQNAPAWATFDPVTGELSGTPTTADVSTFSNIIISASDGKKSASLPAFAISVTQSSEASVSLSWAQPTQNANGTALTDLAGYYIYYGTSASQLTQSVRIADPRTTSYVISKLSPGTWYFSIVSFTTANEQSTNSVVVSASVN